MRTGRLVDIGFTENEAMVYLALARRKKSDAGTLIKDTAFHKKIVYENLDKLHAKGLVTIAKEGGRRVYTLADPHTIHTLIDEKAREIEKQRELAESIIDDVQQLTPPRPHEQEAEVLRGTRGVRNFYRELIADGKDYVGFGGPRESLHIMGEAFWLNLVQKKRDAGIHARFVFNQSLRDYGERIADRFTQVRFFDRDQEPLTETHIRPGVVAFIVWTEEPVVFLIRDDIVAQSYLEHFERVWEAAGI